MNETQLKQEISLLDTDHLISLPELVLVDTLDIPADCLENAAVLLSICLTGVISVFSTSCDPMRVCFTVIMSEAAASISAME